jgi:hypothetical protein
MDLMGPYLKAALLCDEIIEGKDGVLSLIRVVDRLTVTAAGAAPGAMPPVPHRLKLVIMLISGQARGTHTVTVMIETPDGIVHPPAFDGTVLLEGEDRGANVVVELDYEFKMEGVYWFRLVLDGGELTRVPFRVLYQRVGPGIQQ